MRRTLVLLEERQQGKKVIGKEIIDHIHDSPLTIDGQNPEVSDTTGDAKSTKAGNQKIIYQSLKTHLH